MLNFHKSIISFFMAMLLQKKRTFPITIRLTVFAKLKEIRDIRSFACFTEEYYPVNPFYQIRTLHTKQPPLYKALTNLCRDCLKLKVQPSKVCNVHIQALSYNSSFHLHTQHALARYQQLHICHLYILDTFQSPPS